MLKLLGSLFSKKVKVPGIAVVRNGNPFAEILSTDPAARSSTSPTRSTVQRIELKPPPVLDLFEREQQNVHEAFRIIDKNGDGKISQDELGAMWERLGEKVTDEELRLMVEQADTNGDGVIDLDEFVILSRNIGLGGHDHDLEKRAEELRLAFNVADSDRDGFISAADLQKLMRRLGKRKATIRETTTMVKCVDSDGDSKIDYQDFEKLIRPPVHSKPEELQLFQHE
ncbi:hypothetical protein AXG93_2277s1020 [Marchantia polymorpha subsp. ruderalis]|uniref:EF-hand domain-containing protein n=1 Tax=Marchantia polymorpha subsp. ruderalis TaxID=1480154 RepID=A0A176W1P5_MARPO|nr:hypothetical protein AXG93_2277s1020 [Marchantia polymorpha subsp. ruderalis]